MCVCVLARAQALFSPTSFHGIRAWFRLREARQAQEGGSVSWYQEKGFLNSALAKRVQRKAQNQAGSGAQEGWRKELTISSPLCWLLHPCRELFGGGANDIGFRSCLHRIEGAGELYNPLDFGQNFGAKIAFWVHLDLRFGVRVRSHALSIIVKILQNSIF